MGCGSHRVFKNEAGETATVSYSYHKNTKIITCLLYTSDAADERSSVDLGGRRIIKKKKKVDITRCRIAVN